MRKKILAVLLCAIMVGSLTGCQKSPANNAADNSDAAEATELEATDETPDSGVVELTVWAEEDNFEMLNAMIESFKQEYAGQAEFNITLGVQADGEVRNVMLRNVHEGADVFHFPDDQLNSLITGGVLSAVPNADEVKAANVADAVAAASLNDVLYGYPMTADNGYYLYYDKSVLTEEDVKTLDGILAAANKAGKQVHMDISNGWYLASFFLGNGCQLTLDKDGKQICDFNNEKGLAAAEAIRAFCNDPAFVTGDDSVLQGGIGDNICCGVSGPWTSASIKEKLGDNFAAAKLPTFTCNGEQVQMGSFLGCKVLGVNTQTAHPVEAMQLAEYLTNEQSQARRFEVLGYGPSNINVANSDAVASDPALKALAEQSKYAISQHVNGAYWTPAEAFGAELEAHTTEDLQAKLEQLVEQATAE